MKKKFIVLSSVFVALALASCSPSSGNSTITSSGNPVSSSSSSSSTETGDIQNDDLPLGQTTYKDATGVTQQLNRSSIYRTAGSPHVDSYHSATQKPQKLLVAPISFDKDASDTKDTITADDALLEKIRVAFAGTSIETAAVGGYISVQDFYKTSSYGHGGFDVVVLPTWVHYNGTPSAFQSASGGNGGLFASEYVRTWYLAEYAKTDHGSLGATASPLSDFDTDNDGYVDLIWNVYAYPYVDTNFWWAYVTYSGNQPNVGNPNIKTLAFASTNFMSGYNGYDSHTFIHETGHTLGLDDYYDYSNTWAPMAGVDYMDHNLGDHNSYSKFSLGWVNPWILKESDLADGKSAVITLRSASISGDSLVLASPNYNGTAFDEYLMVELVGPYGLCKTDYLKGYESTTGFTQPGIRILHIDARAYGSSTDGGHDNYLKTADDIGQKAIDLRLGNTYAGRSGVHVDSDYWTLSDSKATKKYYAHASLMESTIAETNWTKISTYNATNDSLFHVNSRFSLATKYPWAKAFMPSESNLWNKAKTITSWSGTTQKYTVDESVTCNYFLKVLSITADDTYGAIAKVKVTLNA
jgi:M6 family metalloprotease-like protein